MKKTLMILSIFLCHFCFANDARQVMEYLKNGDEKAAVTLSQSLCIKGDKVGCVLLATVTEALCNEGDSQACILLASLYLAIDKWEKAQVLMLKACDMGNSLGCTKAGEIYKLEKNYEQAWVAYKKACDLGDELACNALQQRIRN